MQKYKENKTTARVFLILGRACNMNCKYCAEHQNQNTLQENHINPLVYKYLDYLQSKYNEVFINFFGGEPTLYKHHMQEIINKLSHNSHFSFATMTNGKAFDSSWTDFCNQNNIMVNISWDGPKTFQTRGYDVFKENTDNILKCNNLWISSQLTTLSYPLEVCNAWECINNQYYKLHGYNSKLFLGITEDDDFSSPLSHIDCDRLYNEMCDVVNSFIQGKINTGRYALATEIVSEFMMKSLNVRRDTFNFDIQGNILFCPFRDTKEITNGSITAFPKQKRHSFCKDCEIRSLCNGICIYNKKPEIACKIAKAFYSPFGKLFGGNINGK